MIPVLPEASGRERGQSRRLSSPEKPGNARVVREHKGDSRGVLTADRKNSRESCRGQDSRSREYPQADIHPPDSPLNFFFPRQRPPRSREGTCGTARCLGFSRRTRGAGIPRSVTRSVLACSARPGFGTNPLVIRFSPPLPPPPLLGRETSRDSGDRSSGTVDRGWQWISVVSWIGRA